MVVTMKPGATEKDVESIRKLAKEYNLETKVLYGEERTVIALIGDERNLPFDEVRGMPRVEAAIPILKKYKLVSREYHPRNGVVRVNSIEIGGGDSSLWQAHARSRMRRQQ